jgi:hypothetical protein
MNPAVKEVLSAIRAAGGRITYTPPDELRVTAPQPLPDELMARARKLKPQLLEIFSEPASSPAPQHQASADDVADDLEERAAIVEHDGGVPSEWVEAFVRLDPRRPPANVSAVQWLRYVDACGHLVDDWAHRAIALGMAPHVLLGDGQRGDLHTGKGSLAWFLAIEGGKLTRLDAAQAMITTADGRHSVFRRVANSLAWVRLH